MRTRTIWSLIATALGVVVSAYLSRHFLTALWSGWWADSVFRNAFGSGLGGLLAVLVYFGIRVCIEKFNARPRAVRIYSCAHSQNVGNGQETHGELLHHHGRRVTDAAELATINSKEPVWAWNRDPCGV